MAFFDDQPAWRWNWTKEVGSSAPIRIPMFYSYHGAGLQPRHVYAMTLSGRRWI